MEPLTARIVAAAVRDGFGGPIHILPPPAGHREILQALDDASYRAHHQCLGFLDDAGRYRDRNAAFRIAAAAGQLARTPRFSGILLAEDLWPP